VVASETLLAKKVTQWLEAQGWEIFPEVQCPRKRRVVDIYARRTIGGILETWAIEVKAQFGLQVLEQANYWQGHAHKVSIAVPALKARRAKIFAYKIVQLLGLGMLEIGKTVTEHQQPRRYPAPKIPQLVNAQKSFAPGNNRREYWTPFKGTVEQLQYVVKTNPGVSLADAISQIDHHYKSARSAQQTLIRHINSGTVTGIRQSGSRINPKLYPT